MLRLVLLAGLTAGPALAQSTVPVEDAPFKESGSLAGHLDPMEIVDSDAYPPVPRGEVTGELLSKSRVVDFEGKRIGAVSGVIEEEGRVVGIVLTVGGALGTLTHPVALPMDAVVVGRSEELGDSRIVVGLSEDDLAALPPYRGTGG